VAWGIDTEGRKHLLHLAVGNKESEAAWTEFFRHMVARGLRLPTTVTTDGASGVIKAVNAVFANSVRIRCRFHRLSNIRAKLPDDDAPEVMAHIYAVRDAPTQDAARAAVERFENTFARRSPLPLPASMTTATPSSRSTECRCATASRFATNLVERGFEEERVAPRSSRGL
jgi:putative transposase